MRHCEACKSPARGTIDAALVHAKKSLRELSREFGLSPWALHRHRQRLGAVIGEVLEGGEVLKKPEAAELGHAEGLLGQVRELIAQCRILADESRVA